MRTELSMPSVRARFSLGLPGSHIKFVSVCAPNVGLHLGALIKYLTKVLDGFFERVNWSVFCVFKKIS